MTLNLAETSVVKSRPSVPYGTNLFIIQLTEYSLAPTDDLIRFWRSKVKVTAGSQGVEEVHVNAGWSKSPSSDCPCIVL